MSVAMIALALYLLLTGLSLLGIAAISSTLLGVLALIAGILFLVSEFHPLNIPVRRRDV